jgi:hypothetical protein
MRELEAFRRAAHHELDRTGLGLRLKYLSGNEPQRPARPAACFPSAAATTRPPMAEPLVNARIAQALRASVGEFQAAEDEATGIRTA